MPSDNAFFYRAHISAYITVESVDLLVCIFSIESILKLELINVGDRRDDANRRTESSVDQTC